MTTRKILLPMNKIANKALHLTAIPLRFMAAGELCRYKLIFNPRKGEQPMKSKLQFIVIAAITLTSIIGCSSGDISGTYSGPDGSETMTLTKDGKFIHPRGSGEYSVEDGNVIIAVPMVGGTKGKIDGDTLVFSDQESRVGRELSGTWTKTE